jgi:hypothetical protein
MNLPRACCAACFALLLGWTGCGSDAEDAPSRPEPDASVPTDALGEIPPGDAGDAVEDTAEASVDAPASDVSDASDDTTTDVANDVVDATAPSCSDGVQNGSEQGVDCGGTCLPCAPVFSDREIGIRYHSLVGSPDVFGATFINDYHLGNNRNTAISQMQAMVDQGVTVIHTTIWPAGGPPASWGSHFPLSQQELENLGALVQDVRGIRSAADGHAPRLYLSLLDGGDSQFKTVQVNNVFPIAAGGSRDGGQFLEAWRQTIHDIVDTVGPIRHADGTPVLQRMYLGGEIMLHADGSSPYDGPAGWVLQWFLTHTIPELFSACEAADIVPNTYLFAWPITASKIMDGSWLDITDETMQWWGAALPSYVPERVDISTYTGDHNIPDYTSNQRARILATADAMDQLVNKHFGAAGRPYAFVEAHYYQVEADHPSARQEAFNTYRDMMNPAHPDHHEHFAGVHVWPYPYSIQGGPNENGAAPPFDFSDMVE